MKKLLIILLTLGVLLTGANFLLERFFFKSHLNESPEITNIKLDVFEFNSSKPFFYSKGNQLYYSSTGKLNHNQKPVQTKQSEKVYVSPDGDFAIVYTNKKLTLIDKRGKELFTIDDCTGLFTVEDARKSKRYLSTDIQWLSNSKGFLISQDRVWDKNYSDKNKTSIYQYTIDTKQFSPLVHLNEECTGDFYLFKDGKHLFYEYATEDGDLAFKKILIKSKEIVSTHFQDDSLNLTKIKSEELFINYNDYKSSFQGNSHNRTKIVVESWGNLYFDDKDTTVNLLSGTRGMNAFKGNSYGFSSNGYFLPGNRYFTTVISSKNVNGTLVVDTQSFKTMILDDEYKFYFNVNNTDCSEFEFRYSIVPRVRFATSVSNDLHYK
jgi:hypothetical protein